MDGQQGKDSDIQDRQVSRVETIQNLICGIKTKKKSGLVEMDKSSLAWNSELLPPISSSDSQNHHGNQNGFVWLRSEADKITMEAIKEANEQIKKNENTATVNNQREKHL